MSGLRSLVKDTAIYGLSSIIGRFLNWCLVPLYTHLFSDSEYGIVTYVYAIVAVALIVLTYGMETGFFRFANHERWKSPAQVYTTSLISLGATSIVFIIAVCLFCRQIASVMDCASHPSYIWMMAIAVGVDAYCCIPFSYLRYKKRPLRFAALKLANIGLNIGLNLFFLILCPIIMESAPKCIDWFYNAEFGIGYIFLANLISSLIILILLLPEIFAEQYSFCCKLLREMLTYSFPMLVLGIAGLMNQTIDKILLPHLYPDKAQAMAELGIYGANYKIAIVMVMFIQAFRFAYEPFIFARNRETDAMRTYADAMKYFIIFALFIFMGVMFFLPTIRYFISPAYFSGLKVVPLIMIAELMFGIFFNLSIWYKLTDSTIWGTWFSILGLVVTVVLNVLLVPHIGYMGCAVAAVCCYFVMMLSSWLVGRRRFPVPYQLGRIGFYCLIAAMFCAVAWISTSSMMFVNYSVRILLLILYAAIVLRREHIPLPSRLTLKSIRKDESSSC